MKHVEKDQRSSNEFSMRLEITAFFSFSLTLPPSPATLLALFVQRLFITEQNHHSFYSFFFRLHIAIVKFASSVSPLCFCVVPFDFTFFGFDAFFPASSTQGLINC